MSVDPDGGDSSWLTIAGNSYSYDRGLNGGVDEVRISTDVKAPAWVALQHASMATGVVRRDPVETRP